MGNKLARTIVFFYTIILHVLVFLVSGEIIHLPVIKLLTYLLLLHVFCIFSLPLLRHSVSGEGIVVLGVCVCVCVCVSAELRLQAPPHRDSTQV